MINGIYAFLGNVAFAGSSIIVAMIFLKYTSLESLGVFSSFMAAYMLIGAFKPLTWQAYVKFKSSDSNKDILPSSLRLDLIGISCFFPVFLIGLLLQIFFETPISMLELFCLLIVAPINNIGTVVGYLRANRYFSIFSLLQIIIALIRIVGCVLFFEIEESNPERSIFIFFALVDLCIWFIALLLILVKEKPALFQVSAFKGAGFHKFSWQGTKVTLVDAPVNHLDYLVVLVLLGAEAVGVFELVKRLSKVFGQFAEPVYQVLFPELSDLAERKAFHRVVALVKKVTFTMLAFCLLGTTGVFFVFDYVNEYFFSNGLLELKYEVVVFMLLQSIAISFIWVHPLLVALGKLQLNFHLTLAANAAYMLLLISLLKLLGMWALVIAIGFQFAIVVGGKFIFISSYLKNKRDVRETYDT